MKEKISKQMKLKYLETKSNQSSYQLTLQDFYLETVILMLNHCCSVLNFGYFLNSIILCEVIDTTGETVHTTLCKWSLNKSLYQQSLDTITQIYDIIKKHS